MYPFTRGGSDRVVYEVAKRLIDKDFKVTVVLEVNKKEQLGEHNVEGIKVHTYLNDQRGLKFNILRFFKPNEVIKKLLRKECFDFIHYHMLHSSILPLVFNKSFNIKSFYTLHGRYEKELKANFKYILMKDNSLFKKLFSKFYILFFSYFQKKALISADKIIVLSHFMETEFSEINYQKEKLIHISGGVDNGKFCVLSDNEKKEVREKFSLDSKDIIISTMRRLVPRTGVDLLIRSFIDLSEEYENLKLLIIGTGELKKQFEEIVKEKSLQEKIIFTGFVSDEELVEYYQITDLNIMPTLELEGFGLSTLESLACGVPVLATPVGANVEIVSSINEKLVVDNVDIDSLKKGLETAINNNLLARNTSLRNKCLEYANDHDWDVIAQQYKILF